MRLTLVVVGFLLVFVPLIIAYVQSELNKVWRNPAMTDDPAGVLTPQAQRPAIPPAVPPPPAPPVAGHPTAAQPAPPAPAPAQTEPAAAATTATEADPQLERLERLAALRDSGALTPDEYEAQKARILEEL